MEAQAQKMRTSSKRDLQSGGRAAWPGNLLQSRSRAAPWTERGLREGSVWELDVRTGAGACGVGFSELRCSSKVNLL